VLTVVTGLVDAVAYLRLGHVFDANMTGNVVCLGFVAGGAGGLSVWGSLLALACFLPGGIAAGRSPPAWGPTGNASSLRRRRLSWFSARSPSRSRRSAASNSVRAAAIR